MKKVIYQIINPVIQQSVISDLILAIPRILCGILLAISFGGSKFGVPWSPAGTDLALFEVADWFPKDVAAFGGIFALAPLFFAWMAAFAEAVGGVFLILGLKTRMYSFLIACTMLVAVVFQQSESGIWSMLPALGFLWVAIQGIILGSGRFGLDYVLAKKLVNWSKINHMKVVFSVMLIMASCLLIPTKTDAKITKVLFQVDMNQVENVGNVAVRGAMEPLSWDRDFQLTDEDNDGIYTGSVEIDSPYRFLKFKFVNDGAYELMGGGNRAFDLTRNKSVIYHFNEYYALSKEEQNELKYSDAQIEEDIAVLKQTLTTIHPALYAYQSQAEFQAELENLERAMKRDPSLTNAYLLVSRFLSKIKCSHTFSNPYNQKNIVEKAFFHQADKLPLTFSRAGKSLLINRFVSENPEITKGLEIVSINGVLTAEILDNLKGFISADGNNEEKKLQRLTMSGSAKVELFDIYFCLIIRQQTIF